MGMEKETPEEKLNRYIGDIFVVVEPVHNTWRSEGKVLFVKFHRHNNGRIDWLRQQNFIEMADEVGGNNVIRVIIK